MTERDDLVYLKHIKDAILRIEEYSAGIAYEEFVQDTLVQDGVTLERHRGYER